MKRGLAAGVCLLLSAAAIGCTVTAPPEPAASPAPAGSATADTGGGVAALPPACHLQGALPDMTCAPGATDPVVTQANIQSTICVSGYTTKVRPPVSYTNPIKTDLIRRYGLTGSASAYELDHLVPLEVGGAARSIRNLWPEPRNLHPGASEKDQMENLLHSRVCQGRMQLAEAQRMFEQDWVQAWRQLAST